MMSAEQIARAEAVSLGDVAVERGLVLKRTGHELVGPCPLCGGRDRFGVNLIENLFNCRGCGGKGRGAIVFARLLDGCGFRDAVETLVGERSVPVKDAKSALPAKGPSDYEQRQHDKARWLWSQRQPITGSIAEVYLRTARGITCPLPPTLGFLPPRKPDQFSAMIASFGVCDEPEPGLLAAPRDVIAVHLTLLRPDGTGKAEVKPNKLMIGSPSGLPIVLAVPNDLCGMAITEGIEDALSAHQALGLGAWAAGAAGFMPKLANAVPDYIEALTIFAHDDKAGRDGAHKLAAKLDQRNIEVLIEGLS